MTLQDRFLRDAPDSIYFDFDQEAALINLVREKGWISPSVKVLGLEKPGDGNMNFVVRIRTTSGSIVIKQSRPWVEKYPDLEAPMNRVLVEASFYSALQRDDFFDDYCPTIIGFDASNYLLALEDLGENADYTTLYQQDAMLPDAELERLVAFISHLHNSRTGGAIHFPDNGLLKKLNHTHIFDYPFQVENGFDLDSIQSGLQALATPYKTDSKLKAQILTLGDIYLGSGNTLIHGDYYPGSWLKTSSGVKVIDPEFSHFGQPEFDLGVMIAHLKIAGLTSSLRRVWSSYKKPVGFDVPMFIGFCGVEIMRRLLGVAQLPLQLSLEAKADLLSLAGQCVRHPEERLLF